MVRAVVCAFALSGFVLAGCTLGQDAPVDDPASSNQQLQKKKDGSATGDGSTCSWEGTTTADVCSPHAPTPQYRLGDEFPSIDGCNECECTTKGIMCTVRICSGGGNGSGGGSSGGSIDPVPPVPPVPPSPPIACDASLRICKDGSPGKQLPDSCKQICPEDGYPYPGEDPGGKACPAIGRICKDNVPAKQIPETCELICPEDPVQK